MLFQLTSQRMKRSERGPWQCLVVKDIDTSYGLIHLCSQLAIYDALETENYRQQVADLNSSTLLAARTAMLNPKIISIPLTA